MVFARSALTTTAIHSGNASTTIGASTRPAFLSAPLVYGRAHHEPVAKAWQAADAGGQAQGDVMGDFTGNGTAAGDRLEFRSHGSATQGANLAQIDTLTWPIASAGGRATEVIRVASAAVLHNPDWSVIPRCPVRHRH